MVLRNLEDLEVLPLEKIEALRETITGGLHGRCNLLGGREVTGREASLGKLDYGDSASWP